MGNLIPTEPKKKSDKNEKAEKADKKSEKDKGKKKSLWNEEDMAEAVREKEVPGKDGVLFGISGSTLAIISVISVLVLIILWQMYSQ